MYIYMDYPWSTANCAAASHHGETPHSTLPIQTNIGRASRLWRDKQHAPTTTLHRAACCSV